SIPIRVPTRRVTNDVFIPTGIVPALVFAAIGAAAITRRVDRLLPNHDRVGGTITNLFDRQFANIGHDDDAGRLARIVERSKIRAILVGGGESPDVAARQMALTSVSGVIRTIISIISFERTARWTVINRDAMACHGVLTVGITSRSI